MSFNKKEFKESIGLNALHRVSGHKHGERHSKAKAKLIKKMGVSLKMVNYKHGHAVKDADRDRED